MRPFQRENSEMNVFPHELPHYESSRADHTVRSNNAWEAPTARDNNGMNQMTDADWKSNCSKLCAKITSAKILYFLIGFILCAIPLAVMTTLWINARSTSTASSTAATITISSASSLSSLPVQCYAYTSLTDVYRNIIYGYGCSYGPSDTSPTLTAGWYRVSGSAGTQLVTSVVATTCTCGINYPGYFNGTLPSTVGALTTGNVCFYQGSICGYSLSPISVTNCNGYYVFYLIPTANSYYKYCTTS